MRRWVVSALALAGLVLAGCGVRLAISMVYEHHMPADELKAAGEAASAAGGALRGVRASEPEESQRHRR